MKNSFGSSVILTLFGESHGIGIGAVLDGLAPGITVDEDFIRSQLSLRRPVGDISTPRAEPDNFVIESGVFGGKTTGTPICIVIPNVNSRSKDYSELRSKARPGHADYAAYTKYHGFEDYRGGGHFSGRITAGIVAAGAVAISALKNKGIYIGTHIKSIAGVADREFRNIADDIKALSQKEFAVLEDGVKEKMISEITAAKADGDSVGGVLETAVLGLPAGLGAKFEALSFSIFYTAAQYQSREELLRGFGAALVLLLLASGLLVCARLLEARFRRRWQGEA